MSSGTPYQDQRHNDDLGRQSRQVIFLDRYGELAARTGDSVIMINLAGVLVKDPGHMRKLIPWNSILELSYHQNDESMTATMLKLKRG